ncbi:ADP-ribosyltransferase [Actinocrispum sp. NPDC049592]|uniref:ADP-ribosyltransferase n=1 Tax=Actinocrispum sp. NPDC049592 TaxID=3154835 RepID=UPI0034415C3E
MDALKVIAGTDTPDQPNQAGLRRAEREAVSAYTGGSFRTINEYVANGNQPPAHAADDKDYAHQMRQQARALERAVNRSRLDAPATATRAIHPDTAERVYGPIGSQIGQTITEPRFTSTTKGDTPLDGFGNVTIHYDLAAGTKALDVNASGVPCKQDENELLLGPHQPFRVTSDQIVNGRRVLHMTNADNAPATAGRDTTLRK